MAAMEAEAIRGLLVQAFPDAVELTVEDRTGTGDHFQVDVTSPSFDGLSLVDQHRRAGFGRGADDLLGIGALAVVLEAGFEAVRIVLQRTGLGADAAGAGLAAFPVDARGFFDSHRISFSGGPARRRGMPEGGIETCGHGVGRTMHGDPHVSNDGRPGRGLPLKPGLVIAIEPWFLHSTDQIYTDRDGWTLRSVDGSRGAHSEHTVAVTPDGPLVLTARG